MQNKAKFNVFLRTLNILVHPVPWGLLVIISFVAAVWVANQNDVLRIYGIIAVSCALLSLLIFSWAVGRRGGIQAVSRNNRRADNFNSLIIDGLGRSKIGLAVFDNYKFPWSNSVFKEIFGFSQAKKPDGGWSLDVTKRYFDANSGDLVAFERFCDNSASGQEDNIELLIRKTDKTQAWCRISTVPFGDNKGLWRIKDISAEHAIQSEIIEREAWFYDVVEFMPAGFLSVDAFGRILTTNDRLADWLGEKKAELPGHYFSEFVIEAESITDESHGFSLGRVKLNNGRGGTLDGTLVQTAKETISSRGVKRPAYTRSLIVPGVIPEKAIQESKIPLVSSAEFGEQVQWLFAEAPVGIALLDLDGRIVGCNSAFGELFGTSESQLIGQSFSELSVSEDQSELKAVLSKVVMGVGRSVHLEIRMPGGDARELAVSLYASRIEDTEGEVSGLVVHLVDVTEQRDLEIQFAQSQKMQAVGQLAGGVAHDFNNLLTAMIGFADLLLVRKGPDDPDFSDLMQIKQNANRATNLVRQLLAFSRKQNLAPIEMDVVESLDDLSNLLKRLIGETVEVKIVHGAQLGPVLFDKGQFDQVMINLCVNARDAMPGGGNIVISSAREVLKKPVQRGHDHLPAGNYVRIDVSDTGEGIPKENLARIFDPFFSTKEVGAGTGLGLSTVYGIIHQTGGFIFVDSAVGQGTIFSIYLPEQDISDDSRSSIQEPKTHIEKTEPEGDLTGQGCIVLVEDEDAVRLFASRALRAKGYDVLEANDGETALEVIASSKSVIDLIVSDVVMPGMDGHTMVQLVRQEIPHIKVILMSGYSEDVFQGEFQNDPKIAFLGKPFTLKGLAGKVKEVLNA
ncbi:MAG: Blue-light-activated protein [Alphaproteobacteria bacterium MarineAlpha3_Bin5]|nr:hybrid sensor histidine kinase/response regulator [Magnetovibrio sp.]PPR80080.1 MAG: Blue-light-activated protein [Alphaproteobacteria bacterium MarineAlpha3_Bin5]